MMNEFNKLDEQQIQDVVRQIRHDQSVLSFKFPGVPVFKAKASQNVWQKYLVCIEPQQIPANINWTDMAAINVNVDDDLYFFKTKVIYERKQLHITIPSEMLHLQRRKKRRVKVPDDFPAFFLVESKEDGGSLLKCSIIDISNEGIKVGTSVDYPKMKNGDNVTGQLCLDDLDPQTVSGVIRHHKVNVGQHKQVFGLEFAQLSSVAMADIEKTVLDLQRDFFLRMLD